MSAGLACSRGVPSANFAGGQEVTITTTEEELLNRIAAIRAAAEILNDDQELSHGDRHAFLTVIEIETLRLQTLVRQIASLFPDCLSSGSATAA